MSFTRLYTSLLIFCVFILPNQKASAQSSRPNIVFILGDDIGYKTITANGGHRYSTPNLDSLAANGIRFTECHSSPLCSPSRFMLLTGKYNFRNYTQWGVMDQSQKTFGNLFKDAGYVTACYGKWQLGGGSESVQKFGFDNYCISYPFTPDPYKTSIYKDPVLYANGQVIPALKTLNKYGDDIITDSVNSFIERNSSHPFFVYYPMLLGHRPFQPTPDDPAFASWNSTDLEDTVYYPSMVSYMDKKIGQIVDKIKSLHIEGNTIIIYSGDNGTPNLLKEYSDSEIVSGGKGKPTELGTHVPLIVSWLGKIAPGTVNNDLVDFTDLLPTFAKLGGITIPTSFGPIDGVDFSPQLIGQPGNPRSWIFDHYNPKLGTTPLRRWAQTKTYKLIEVQGKLYFYDLFSDRDERKPIPDIKLTPEEKVIKDQLQAVLDKYAAESGPILFATTIAGITDSSAVLGATVADQVLSPVVERGTIYNPLSLDSFMQSHPLAEGGTELSPYTQRRKNLAPQQSYFFRGYAINGNDTGYSPTGYFYTLSKGVVSASQVFNADQAPNSVALNWSPATFPASGAAKGGYLLIYSDRVPSTIPLPDGLAPINTISNGRIVPMASERLPATADTSVVVTGLRAGTQYHFLLIPYTWNGLNASTYHYFTQGQKTASAQPGAIGAKVFPNPSSTQFALKIISNSVENVDVTVADVNGRRVFETKGNSNEIFYFGRSLAAGMYFVTVLQDGNKVAFKVMKGK